jgi:hypothetical protein
MKVILLLTLCCLFFVANGFKCRALALGGGGDRGAYEGLNLLISQNSAGILQAFSQFEKEENMKWDVISGKKKSTLKQRNLCWCDKCWNSFLLPKRK